MRSATIIVHGNGNDDINDDSNGNGNDVSNDID